MKDKNKVGIIDQKGKGAEDLVLIGTKITKQRAEMFNTCARFLGYDSGYALLQIIIDCVLRFAGSYDNASKELLDIVNAFDGFKLWRDYARMSAGNTARQVLAAIYLIREEGSARHSYAEMLRESELGQLGGFDSTTNRNDILNAVFKAVDPATLRRLTKEMKQRRIYTISGVINSIIDELTNEDRSDYIKSLFEDNERDEIGGGTAIARPEMKNRNRRRNLKGLHENEPTIFTNSKTTNHE